MRRTIPSVHGKSHEDRAYHGGRSGGRSALARALDPNSVDMLENDTPLDMLNPLEGSVYDEATGPLDTTRRNKGIEWAPTEYEQLQNRYERDQMLDAVTEFFKDER